MSTLPSYSPNPAIYVVPIVMVLIFSMFVGFGVRQGVLRRRRYLHAYYSTPAFMSSDQWERRVGAEVEERQAQIEATTLGEQIWFSRYMCGGVVKHWTFIIHGTKYELSRDLASGNYSYSSGPSSITEEQERANLAETTVPETDGYYTCLIGWTKKERSQIWSAFEQCQNDFGRDTLLASKCGRFMDGFASKITATWAIDRRWFSENTQGVFKASAPMPRAPPALVSARIRSQERMRQREAHNSEVVSILARNIGLNQQLLNQQMPSAVLDPPPSYSRSHHSGSSFMHSTHHHHMATHHSHHAMAMDMSHSSAMSSSMGMSSSGGGMSSSGGGGGGTSSSGC